MMDDVGVALPRAARALPALLMVEAAATAVLLGLAGRFGALVATQKLLGHRPALADWFGWLAVTWVIFWFLMVLAPILASHLVRARRPAGPILAGAQSLLLLGFILIAGPTPLPWTRPAPQFVSRDEAAAIALKAALPLAVLGLLLSRRAWAFWAGHLSDRGEPLEPIG